MFKAKFARANMKIIWNKIDIDLRDIAYAASLLTRIPLSIDHDRAGQRAQQACWAYPVVGAALGAIVGLLGYFLISIGVLHSISAVFCLIALVMLTGAMHEDGIADCADGFWGAMSVKKRLEIMKDSRIGAYGTIAIVLTLLARWSGILPFSGLNLILGLAVVGAISRASMLLIMHQLPYARNDGLAASVGHPETTTIVIGVSIAFALAVVCFGFAGVGVFTIGMLPTLAIAWLAMNKIGGQTGDVLGATQQVSEIVSLTFLFVFL